MIETYRKQNDYADWDGEPIYNHFSNKATGGMEWCILSEK